MTNEHPNPNEDQKTPSALSQANGSARCRIDTARIERLNRGLLVLASWCRSRAMLPHRERTTATMLRRKVDELFAAVDEAGWAAAKMGDASAPCELTVWEDAADLIDEASEEYRRLSVLPNVPYETSGPHN